MHAKINFHLKFSRERHTSTARMSRFICPEIEGPGAKRKWAWRLKNERAATFVTWNCLAQSLAEGFDDVAPEQLAWHVRLPKLAQELWRCLGSEHPGQEPAVVALQEVDEACVEELVAAARLGSFERVFVRKGAGEGASEGEERPDGGMLVLHNLAQHYAECGPVTQHVVRYSDPRSGAAQSQRGLVLVFGE